jgi:SAM-dependent methyltransferase
MIENARELNQYPEKCRYFLNAQEDLQIFADDEFSFIYSNVVLQHIPPQISRRYLVEFARVLRPGGLLVFQLPSRFALEEGLPAEAFAAKIEWLDVTSSCRAGIHGTVHVRVTNASPVPWRYRDRQALMIGNHWRDADGKMVRRDDGRTVIRNGLAPGEHVEVSLDVSTPPNAGRFIFELDVVQESVAWFADKGSQTLRAFVDVTDAAASPAPPMSDAPAEPNADPAPQESAPAFEGFSMHVVPRPEVIDLLYQHEMRLEFIHESDRGGPGYHDYIYYARKAPRTAR